eukprot:GEMP01023980.1.p1 GENE.GEMP01023980.1~~GEMP01023980.1.p1  ORF type:complete len:260 (-),score=27.80 GEMP01023980.1:1501-2280(-)
MIPSLPTLGPAIIPSVSPRGTSALVDRERFRTRAMTDLSCYFLRTGTAGSIARPTVAPDLHVRRAGTTEVFARPSLGLNLPSGIRAPFFSLQNASRLSANSLDLGRGYHSLGPNISLLRPANVPRLAPLRKPSITPIKPLVAISLTCFSLAPPPESEWVTVGKKKNKRKVAGAQTIKAPPMTPHSLYGGGGSLRLSPGFMDGTEGDAQEWYHQKGQRHNVGKAEKMTRNVKDVQRVAYQTEKRMVQSAKARGWIVGSCP